MIKLNDDQQRAVAQMLDFCNSNELFFMLSGSAGTGKTTCVQHVVKEVERRGKMICLTAPTNKATKVLRSMAYRISDSEQVYCSTVYSLLGLRIDKEHEFVRVQPLAESKASLFNVIVVDEASMVSKDLFYHISEAAIVNNVKFIFMGDPMQLPPVKEERSPTFEIENRAHLYKVERHDNQILNLATHLRECIESGSKPSFKSDNDENGGVWCVDYRKMARFMESSYATEKYQYEPDSLKTIAWRNAAVDSHNAFIRQCIYGKETLPKFMEGERVIATHPIQDMTGTILMSTDEEANCLKVKVAPHPRFKDIETYHLELENEMSLFGLVPVFVPHESSDWLYKRTLSDYYQMAKDRKIKWGAYHDLRNLHFHNVRPCHAITAHRSQGSTYGSVVVDVQDILSNRNEREALQCLYVACTRASKSLILKTR